MLDVSSFYIAKTALSYRQIIGKINGNMTKYKKSKVWQ